VLQSPSPVKQDQCYDLSRMIEGGIRDIALTLTCNTDPLTPRLGHHWASVVVEDLEFGEKSLVVFRQFGVVSAEHVDLHLQLVTLVLVATLEAIRLVAQSSLKVHHVRTQLVDRSLTVLPARQSRLSTTLFVSLLARYLCRWARLVMLAGVYRRLSSSVTLHGGPVVLRPIKATPCLNANDKRRKSLTCRYQKLQYNMRYSNKKKIKQLYSNSKI